MNKFDVMGNPRSYESLERERLADVAAIERRGAQQARAQAIDDCIKVIREVEGTFAEDDDPEQFDKGWSAACRRLVSRLESLKSPEQGEQK